jgi:hypothetical protein
MNQNHTMISFTRDDFTDICLEDLLFDPSYFLPDDSISMIADAFERDDFWSFPVNQDVKPSCVSVNNEESIHMEPALLESLENRNRNRPAASSCSTRRFYHSSSQATMPPQPNNSEMKSRNPLQSENSLLDSAIKSSFWELTPDGHRDDSNLASTTAQKVTFSSTLDKRVMQGQADEYSDIQKSDTQAHKKPTVQLSSTSSQPNTVARALTPYNFFFSYERDRLQQLVQPSSNTFEQNCISDRDHYHKIDTVYWFTNNKLLLQDEILHKHWSRDRTFRRKHRKTNGLIPFRLLTRRISKTWHILPAYVKDVFREIALKDLQRYMSEILPSTPTIPNNDKIKSSN